MDESYKTFDKFNCPFILFQGGIDKLVDPELAIEL
jgi:acylglycerol lipase